MFMRKLNDGGEIPAFGLGTSKHLGKAAVELCVRAIQDGYRLIDTASQYNNEAAIGVAARASGIPRAELFITTKIAGGDQGRGATRKGLEESLRRLDMPYVDLTLIHWPNPSRGLYLETWEELIALRDAGLTRHIGVSNFLPAQLTELHDATGEWPVLNQIQLNPLLARRDLCAFHAEHGIITEPWRPLGPREGLLENPVILRIADEAARTPAQIALRWAVQSGLVPIAVSSRPERNRENLEIFDFELSAAQMNAIAALDQGDRYVWDPLEHEEW